MTVGGYSLNVSFGFATYDSDHWTPKSLAAAQDAEAYDDWATDRLREVMERAGLEFMAQHPDVYYQHLV